jgi:hypothetical protein
VADLVDDARPLRAHLVGLPERRHLLGDRRFHALTRGPGQGRVVEPVEQAVEAKLGGENGAARRLGRVRGEDELQGQLPCGGGEPPLCHPGALEPRERLGQRLEWRSLLVLVLAPPPQAVVLLGEVRELEVERERSQHLGLSLERQLGDRVGQLRPRACCAARPSGAGELADALLGGEQIGPALLDEHPPERLPEQPDVPPKRRVGLGAGGGQAPIRLCNTVLLARRAAPFRAGCSL